MTLWADVRLHCIFKNVQREPLSLQSARLTPNALE